MQPRSRRTSGRTRRACATCPWRWRGAAMSFPSTPFQAMHYVDLFMLSCDFYGCVISGCEHRDCELAYLGGVRALTATHAANLYV